MNIEAMRVYGLNDGKAVLITEVDTNPNGSLHHAYGIDLQGTRQSWNHMGYSTDYRGANIDAPWTAEVPSWWAYLAPILNRPAGTEPNWDEHPLLLSLFTANQEIAALKARVDRLEMFVNTSDDSVLD